MSQNSGGTVRFHKISTPVILFKLRYFTQRKEKEFDAGNIFLFQIKVFRGKIMEITVTLNLRNR